MIGAASYINACGAVARRDPAPEPGTCATNPQLLDQVSDPPDAGESPYRPAVLASQMRPCG